MKKTIFIIVLAFFGLTAKAQNTFQQTYGGTGSDEAFSVQQTSDGGYIIAGWTQSFGTGGKDIYLVKTNSDGNIGAGLGWTKTFAGSGNDYYGYFVQQTNDGGYIITGYTLDYGAALTDDNLFSKN